MSEGKKTILITGATGFIGYAAVLFFSRLTQYVVVAAVRKKPPDLTFPHGVKVIEGLDINDTKGWIEAMQDIDCVLHCAARYHIPKNPFLDTLAICRKINVQGSLLVANAAIEAQVRRFIFLSSLKVHGEENMDEFPFRETDVLRPQFAYGISKMEAEVELTTRCLVSAMELVIIRPPPVYGDRVPANFLLMLKCINMGLPLPIRDAVNLRSYVAVENLLELVRIAADHPAAVGEIFLAGDDRDWSLIDLVRMLAQTMGKPIFFLSISPKLLKWVASLVGKGPVIDILFLPSRVDTTKARKILDWRPIISSEAALKNTANQFLQSAKKSSINKI